MHQCGPVFDHYFNFVSTKTEIYKYEFNLINLDGLEALKKQLTVTWLGIWLNHIEMYVIWRTSQLFLKLDSHISVLGYFCRISVISEFSFLGIGITTKPRKLRKKFTKHVDLLSDHYFNFLSVKPAVNKKKTLFNKSGTVRISWKKNMAHD